MSLKPSANKVQQVCVPQQLEEAVPRKNGADPVLFIVNSDYPLLNNQESYEDFNVKITEESQRPEPCKVAPSPQLNLTKSHLSLVIAPGLPQFTIQNTTSTNHAHYPSGDFFATTTQLLQQRPSAPTKGPQGPVASSGIPPFNHQTTQSSIQPSADSSTTNVYAQYGPQKKSADQQLLQFNTAARQLLDGHITEQTLTNCALKLAKYESGASDLANHRRINSLNKPELLEF